MRRNLQLDILRCVAILMVLTTHIFFLQKPAWWNAWAIGAGWAGVDLFFVLSGFLISRLLFQEYVATNRIRFWRFAFRRAMKIWPPFYAVSLLYLFWGFWRSHPHHWFLTPFLHDAFFMDSYAEGTFGHFWSLAVEEHFYILLPLVLYWLIRRATPETKNPFRAMPWLVATVCVGVLAARLATHILLPNFSYFTHFFPTHLRMDSLLFGVLLGYWSIFEASWFWDWTHRYRAVLIPLALALVSPCLIFSQTGDVPAPPNRFLYTFGFTCLYLGFGLIVVLFFRMPVPAAGGIGFLARMMGGIGKFSYSIYLWHLPLVFFLQRFPIMRSRAGLPIYYSVCILAGIVLAKLIEEPSLRLREFLSRSDAHRNEWKAVPALSAEATPAEGTPG